MNESTTPFVKSMRLFFIDNQASWATDTELVGDYVIWPDQGIYPTATPVSIASHPNFDGKILVQAANHSIVVTLCAKAQSQKDVREQINSKQRPEQYRVAVDALVHRIMLWRNDRLPNEIRDDAHPFTLLEWLKHSHPAEAAILLAGLEALLASPERLKALHDVDKVKDAFSQADDLANALKTQTRESDR